MGKIVVIGPRASGKTTYLAALAYWNSRKQSKKRCQVTPGNENTKGLQDRAENLLMQGLAFVPTKEVAEPYSFFIEIQQGWQPERLNLVARDYPGELFGDLADSKQKHLDYWEDCFINKNGCLLMFADWEDSNDRLYRRSVQGFLKLMDQYSKNPNYRVAAVMSKCERGELWPGRIDPAIDLFELHLSRTKFALEQRLSSGNLGFYALSTFGVLGKRNPRPNRINDPGGNTAVLREPGHWSPYNLFAPLYWLSTGKKIKANVG